MFDTYSFSFAGKSSEEYGILIYDIDGKNNSDSAYGNKANIVEKRLPRRITPLHYGVRYHDDPLSFSLIFGSEYYLDRYQLQEISMWLTGYQDYQWLSVDQPDMEHVQYRCLIQSLTPISVGWCPVAFEAKVICDCPYAYSHQFHKTIILNGVTTVGCTVRNESTIHDTLKPHLRVNLSQGCRSFFIRNNTPQQHISFYGLPGEAISFDMDNENEIIVADNGLNLYEYFNFQFLQLSRGVNKLLLFGKGNIEMSYRFMYNVAA